MQVAQGVFPTPGKDNLVREGLFCTRTQHDQQAIIARWTYCLRGQSMPEFGRRYGRGRPDSQLYGDNVAFEGPQRCHRAL
jgi:hypothetical protein